MVRLQSAHETLSVSRIKYVWKLSVHRPSHGEAATATSTQTITLLKWLTILKEAQITMQVHIYPFLPIRMSWQKSHKRHLQMMIQHQTQLKLMTKSVQLGCKSVISPPAIKNKSLKHRRITINLPSLPWSRAAALNSCTSLKLAN